MPTPRRPPEAELFATLAELAEEGFVVPLADGVELVEAFLRARNLPSGRLASETGEQLRRAFRAFVRKRLGGTS